MANDKHFLPGTPVKFRDQMHFVKSAVLEHMSLIVDEDGNNPQLVFIDELIPFDENSVIDKELALIPDEDWHEAQKRFQIIRPILNMKHRTNGDVEEVAVEEVAKANGITAMTICHWLKLYEEYETVGSLVDTSSDDEKKAGDLELEVEAVISNAINDFYLQKENPSISTIIDKVSFKCNELGLCKPHPNIIRNRISVVCERNALLKRQGNKTYKGKSSSVSEKCSDTNWPMGVIQIDHIPLSVILVDDVLRQPVGRPWLTLAIDIYSRTVAGYYLSFDPPSSSSVSMCLLQTVLPKDRILSEFDIEGEWINQGLPTTIRVDDSEEFRSKALEDSTKRYSIEVSWHPVAQPEWGGHIKHLLGSFSNRFNEFESSKQQSSMSLVEFQKWLVLQILEYHEELHSELRVTPMSKIKRALLGDSDIPGVGLPPLPFDPSSFKLDLLPYVERTIQSYGVIIDYIRYFHDVLTPWVKATCEDNKKIKKEFIFKYDPRDISAIFFWEPKHKYYIRIPYKDMTLPRASIWEHRAARKQAEEIIEKEKEVLIEEAPEQKAIDRMVSQRKGTWVESSITIVNSFPESSKIDNDINWNEPLIPFGDIEEFDE